MGDGTATALSRAHPGVRRPAWADVAWCSSAAVLALVVGAWSLRLWAWSPGTPIDLGWDHTQIAMQLKDIHDHGWYWRNPDLGFPFGQNGSWFPELNVVHVLAVKAIDVVVGNPFTAGGLYFVLSFPLTAVTTYLLFRSQGLAPVAGLVGGVLLANAPGHAERFGHLYLAQYWVVPVALWLVLEVARGRALLSPAEGERPRWRGARTVVTVSAVVVVGLSGVYYVAFTMILLAVAALARRVVGRPADLLRGLGVVAGLAVAIAAPLAAARLGTAGDLVTGRVPAQRPPAESEIFAGKLMDLLLPWPQHRLDVLQTLTFVYDGTSPQPTVETSALGIVGVAGMVGLTVTGLLALLVARRTTDDLGRWSGLMLVSFLLYTVGGLGSFIAFFATGQVRTWSRLSLYILVFALLAVGWWLTRLRRRRGAVVAGVVAAVVTLVGCLDQTNPAEAPDHAAISAEMAGLTMYTTALENAVGPDCAVFQVPVLPYPETLGPARMQGYDQLKPYLTGSDLKFSYGAMRGTAAGDWMLAVETSDVAELAADLRSVGFCALEVDTQGFTPDEDPSAALRRTLGAPTASTPDGVFVAYDLRSAGAEGADDAERRARTLEPVVVSLDAPAPDRTDGSLGQDLLPTSGLSFGNLGPEPVQTEVTLTIQGVGSDPRELSVWDGSTRVAVVELSPDESRTLTIAHEAPPGRSTLTLSVPADRPEGPVTEPPVVARVTDVHVSAPPGVRAVSLLDQYRTGWVVP